MSKPANSQFLLRGLNELLGIIATLAVTERNLHKLAHCNNHLTLSVVIKPLKVATTSPSFRGRVCFTDHRKDIQAGNRKSV